MKLHLTIAKHNRHDGGASRRLVKDVAWTCAPLKGDIMFVGQEEDGTPSSINAQVTAVHFSSHGAGVVHIEALVNRCGDEYEEVCAAVIRDGFARPA